MTRHYLPTSLLVALVLAGMLRRRRVRIALVRGAHDPFVRHDSAFAAAGGARYQYFPVPFAGHSLRRLILAGPIVERAVDFLLAPRTP